MADGPTSGKIGLREADRLALLRSYQVIESEPAGAFDDLVALAARVCGAPMAALVFIEPRRQWFKSSTGLDIHEGALNGSLNAAAVQDNSNLFVVNDIAADGRFAADPVVQAHPKASFYAGATLTNREGAVVGVLCVYGDAPRPQGLEADESESLLALAGAAVRELEGRRALAAPARARTPSRAEAPSLSREMTSEQLQKTLFLSRTIPWELSLPTGKMLLADNARELLGLGSSVNLPRFRDHIHADDQALFDGVIREAMSGAPGEIEVRFKRTRGRQAWLRVRARMLSHFSVTGTLVDVTEERARDRGEQENLTRDHLTGLPSRGALQERLQKELKQARLRRARLVVLFVDIDDLDDVNNMFGHHAGDAVLREAANRLTALVGDRGLVGRARDDEFMLFLRDAGNIESVEAFCASALEALRREFTFEGNTLTTQASIGGAVFPDHQRDTTRLLQSADMALRTAKRSGRDNASLFSARDAREVERIAKETQAIEVGLSRNDILAFYQPVFELESGRVVGLEALARWRHPSKGVLAANYFQSAFENPQTALEITDAMVRSIAVDTRAWSGEGIRNMRVALNVADSELRHPAMAERLLKSLQEASFPAQLVDLEVSEAALLRNDAAMRESFEVLRAAGVRVTLDNFGKTSGSLSILRNVRVDHIKLDRSLIAGMDSSPASAAIVTAMTALCREMQIGVTAEGVETILQLEKLRSMRCERVQGYLLGAPMVAARIPEFMRKLREAQSAPDEAFRMLDEPDPFGPSGQLN